MNHLQYIEVLKCLLWSGLPWLTNLRWTQAEQRLRSEWRFTSCFMWEGKKKTPLTVLLIPMGHSCGQLVRGEDALCSTLPNNACWLTRKGWGLHLSNPWLGIRGLDLSKVFRELYSQSFPSLQVLPWYPPWLPFRELFQKHSLKTQWLSGYPGFWREATIIPLSNFNLFNNSHGGDLEWSPRRPCSLTQVIYYSFKSKALFLWFQEQSRDHFFFL